jgi:hypothetical protein
MNTKEIKRVITWFVSFFSLAAGFIIVLFSVGPLIIRLLAACFGLWLIAYGFELRTGQRAKNVVYGYILSRRWF